jgi:glycosyltransferase involved in cell wall biosynthesis
LQVEKQKIRVLRIINRFNIGGPTYNATFLTKFLSDDFETLLIGGLPEPDESDSLHIPKEYGIDPILIPELKRTPNPFDDRKAYRRIKQIIEDFKPHIVHTHASKAGALGRKAAFSMKVPVVVHTFHGHVFHSYFGPLKTAIFKTIERRLARRSDGIIAISNIQKNELVNIHRIADADKVEAISLGFNLVKFHEALTLRSELRSNLKIHEDEIAVAIVGRLAPIKNHKMFLDAIDLLSKKLTKKLVVFIVGDGSERANIESQIKLMTKVDSLRIIMTSWITNIANFNAAMDIMCLTSNNEGTPVSLIEAQAANLPIVATDVGGVRDVVLLDDTALLVPKNDTALFAEKLLTLIEDEKIRQKMSQNGWNFVKANFDYSSLVQNMEMYYRKLLKSKRNDFEA